MKSTLLAAILLSGLIVAAATGLFAAAGASHGETSPVQSSGIPAFIQPNRCYRFTFEISNAAPNWKILELAEHGWLKTQIDAGPASAQRETVWVNTAQILTARDTRCSD
jgi:hypothetical protein